MIVCVCYRVTDDDIRQAIADGAKDFDDMLDRTNAAGNCGQCLGCARKVYDGTMSPSSNPVKP